MTQRNTVLFGIDEYLTKFEDHLAFLYLLLFFVGIGVSKRATSQALTVLVMALAEFSMNAIRYPVWDFTSDLAIDYEIRLFVWYTCWVVSTGVIAFALQYTHVWLNVTRVREASIILLILMGYIAMHCISFFNQAFFEVQAIHLFYQIGIPTLNLGIAVFLLYSMLRKLINVDLSFALRRDSDD